MGDGRASFKMVIVASPPRNTTATRETPVPARKKQPTDAGGPPATGRKKAARTPAAAPGAAPARKRPEPALAEGAGPGKQDLIIVESPKKAKTISKYLGPGYKV